MIKPEKQTLFTRILKPLSIVSLLTVGLLTGCGVDRGADVNRYDGVYNVNDYTGRVNQFQGRNYDTGRVPFVNDRGDRVTPFNTPANDFRTNRDTMNERFGTTGNIFDNNYILDDDRVTRNRVPDRDNMTRR